MTCKQGEDGFKSTYIVDFKRKDSKEENAFLPWLFSVEKYSKVGKEEWFKDEYIKESSGSEL